MTASTYTAVNRRLSEGRAQLRRLARERDTGAGGVMGPASEAE